MGISYAELWRRRWRFIVKLPRMAGRALAVLLLSSLLLVLVLILVLAPLAAFENWRGHRAWEKFTAECEAAGENLRPESVIPPPVPDEENFAAIPLFAPLYDYTFDLTTSEQERKWRNPDALNRLMRAASLSSGRRVNRPQEPSDWRLGVPFDPMGWQLYFRRNPKIVWPQEPASPVADILFALSRQDKLMNQLHAVVDRPQSRFPVKYSDSPRVPTYTSADLLMNLSMLSSTRALAQLSADHPEAAFRETVLTLKLMQANASEPLSDSQLLRPRSLDNALRAVWEGLYRQAWTDEQLMRLDQLLRDADFIAAYGLWLRGELNLVILPSLELLGKEAPLAFLRGGSMFSDQFAVFEVPQGIRRRYEMPVVHWHHRRLSVVDSDARVFKPAVAREIEAEYSKLGGFNRSPSDGFQICPPDPLPLHVVFRCGYNLWPILLDSGWVEREALRFAHAQSFADLARVAIALERHRLRHGEFPESLDAVDPEVRPAGGIPHDVINGEPLRYRRTEDGRFQLYSVGWNQTDEGGTPGWDEGEERDDGTRRRWPNSLKGDWVWPQPVE